MGKKFGKTFADRIRQSAPAGGDKWHLDEVVVSIAGEHHWLWRAVDQTFVLDVLVQSRRDTRAAQRLMKRLLKSAVTPRAGGSQTSSVPTALRGRRWAFSSNIASRRGGTIARRIPTSLRGEGNGSGNGSNLPPHAQRFLPVHDQVANLFRLLYPGSAPTEFRRASRASALAAWSESSSTGAGAGILVLTAGNTHDLAGAAAVLKLTPTPRKLLADRAYDARKLRDGLAEHGCEPVIPPNPTRKHPHAYDPVADRGRNAIERMFCRLKDFRRIATRYDKRADNFLSAVQLAAAVTWWASIESRP